jgi:glucose-1-phosphate adenylyltransferase
MPHANARMSVNTSDVLSVIMGGGQGSRLFPLTKERSKPAVPLAGKYRLVDIPISNCINSGLKRVYLLTQFNSASLHRHISQSYKFDHFYGGFVEILAAEQTFSDTSWYQGTADAVRKNLVHFLNHDFDYALILSGDQLYRMDFRPLIAQHADSHADLTIATIPVGRPEAQSLGIMQINAERRITRFVEKPKESETLDSLRLERDWYGTLGITGDQEFYLASMGIYIFNRQTLIDAGNVLLGKYHEERDDWTINYRVPKKKTRKLKTVWWEKSHDASSLPDTASSCARLPARSRAQSSVARP